MTGRNIDAPFHHPYRRRSPVAVGGRVCRLPEDRRTRPDVPFEGIDGTKVPLASLRGNVVVLTYWVTWCAPCRAELPLLDRYYDVQKQHGLRVFATMTEDSLPVRCDASHAGQAGQGAVQRDACGADELRD